MAQKYINFGTCKKKMHFFEKISALCIIFAKSKRKSNIKTIQYEEISTNRSLGHYDDDQLLFLENRGPKLRH